MSGYVKAGTSFLKNLLKGGTSSGSGKAIKNIGPNVPKNKLDKLTRDVKILEQKSKATKAMVDQSDFEIKNPQFTKGRFTFDPNRKNVTKKSKKRENKMGGGMMGRRMGLKAGSNGSKKGKVPTTPKEKAFGMLSVKKGLDNNKNITFTDKIAGAKKS